MSERPEQHTLDSLMSASEGRRTLWGISDEYRFSENPQLTATVEQAQAAAEAILANIERDGVTGGGWCIPNDDPSSPYYTPPTEPTPDILDTIDNALGCQRCGLPLGASPSDDFCSPECLRAWHARNTVALDPGSRDAARVYVGQDGRPVPLDEGGDPWQPFDIPDGVNWAQLGEALINPHRVRVRVEHSQDDGSGHTDIRPTAWPDAATVVAANVLDSFRARLWNRITGERQ